MLKITTKSKKESKDYGCSLRRVVFYSDTLTKISKRYSIMDDKYVNYIRSIESFFGSDELLKKVKKK